MVRSEKTWNGVRLELLLYVYIYHVSGATAVARMSDASGSSVDEEEFEIIWLHCLDFGLTSWKLLSCHPSWSSPAVYWCILWALSWQWIHELYRSYVVHWCPTLRVSCKGVWIIMCVIMCTFDCIQSNSVTFTYDKRCSLVCNSSSGRVGKQCLNDVATSSQ